MKKVFCSLRYGLLLGFLALGILVMLARQKLGAGSAG